MYTNCICLRKTYYGVSAQNKQCSRSYCPRKSNVSKYKNKIVNRQRTKYKIHTFTN